MSAVTINADDQHLVFLNCFTVTPENQDRVTRLLQDATDRVISRMPGFISASLHKSSDGRSVINYVQWRSREHFESLFENPEAVEHMMKIRDAIVSSDKYFLRVASTHTPGAEWAEPHAGKERI